MSTLPPLYASLNVALGGAIGAVLRYQVGRWMTGWMGAQAMGVFPWATLAINALGSLLMGVLAGFLFKMAPENTDQWRLLVGTGILGGFTTFSAFSLEVWVMVERGQLAFAALYVVLSVSLAISALVFGLMLTRLIA
ncbi:fluoride efflux transporter CrcB [Parerythrobacter aestuarii]|uniref:fluoride efflux transporter CrcB n=1 Tax=Parerythrobacter aestuarii TaxID=3020909 RepID=UPI0024DE8F6B|nr:fluoride efflux transporter CrcB [Parerythrobacter aestuarii]